MLGLNSKVNYQGRITTIAELAGEGLIVFRAEGHYGKADKPAYFADISKDDGWQISKLAYDKAMREYRIVVNRPNYLTAILGAEPIPTLQPYTFAEKQAAIVAKLAGSGIAWLADVDFQNWEEAYQWLMNTPISEIVLFSLVIDSPAWDGTFPEASR